MVQDYGGQALSDILRRLPETIRPCQRPESPVIRYRDFPDEGKSLPDGKAERQA